MRGNKPGTQSSEMNRIVWGWSLGASGYRKRPRFLAEAEENGDG